jgi:NADPH-dependent glutamate synthase beta subunit-like oxidoreductase
MVRLKINGREVKAEDKMTVLQAAEMIGVEIPTMCFMEGYSNHPSCMVCLVHEKDSSDLFPSCAMPVAEGMEVITEDEMIREARREAIELLLSDHVGDCEAPCRRGCPAFMDIPRMNRLIAEGKFHEALVTVKDEIALPLVLGYICSAPCEKVCRRGPIDQPVSICQLKKFVAAQDLAGKDPFMPVKAQNSGKRVAVVGAGPAGLSAAFYLEKAGVKCSVFDRNRKAGGTLNELPEEVLPSDVLNAEVDYLKRFGISFHLNTNIDSIKLEKEIRSQFDAILLATGELNDKTNKSLGITFDAKGFLISKESGETNLQSVFACGSSVRHQRMAIRVVDQGKKAAYEILTFLGIEKPESQRRDWFNSRFGLLEEKENPEYLKEASETQRVDPSTGKLKGFLTKEAQQEAERCMRCDCRKPQSCKLRIYAEAYGADQKKYLTGERRNVAKLFTHDSIVFEPEKCIKCGLCVEITANEKELTGLTHIGRGFDVKIAVPFNRNLSDALTKTAARCAEACPTGAIAFKDSDER